MPVNKNELDNSVKAKPSTTGNPEETLVGTKERGFYNSIKTQLQGIPADKMIELCKSARQITDDDEHFYLGVPLSSVARIFGHTDLLIATIIENHIPYVLAKGPTIYLPPTEFLELVKTKPEELKPIPFYEQRRAREMFEDAINTRQES